MKNGDTNGDASTEADTQPDFDYTAEAARELRRRLEFLLERATQVEWRLPSLRPVDRPTAIAGLAAIIGEAVEALDDFRSVVQAHAG